MRWILLASLALGACYDPYTVDDYWDELASAHCTAMKDCCTSAEYTDWWTDGEGNRQNCVQAHADATFTAAVREGLRRGTIHFDEARAHSCVIALENLACSEFEPAIRYRESYCETPLIGQLRDGESGCSTNYECRSGHCGYEGNCIAARAVGEDCDSTNGDPCDGGARCNSGICTYGSAGGASCSNDSQCAGDWCKDSGLFQSGTCKQACDGV